MAAGHCGRGDRYFEAPRASFVRSADCCFRIRTRRCCWKGTTYILYTNKLWTPPPQPRPLKAPPNSGNCRPRLFLQRQQSNELIIMCRLMLNFIGPRGQRLHYMVASATLQTRLVAGSIWAKNGATFEHLSAPTYCCKLCMPTREYGKWSNWILPRAWENCSLFEENVSMK
jgi:hypothetical protein